MNIFWFLWAQASLSVQECLTAQSIPDCYSQFSCLWMSLLYIFNWNYTLFPQQWRCFIQPKWKEMLSCVWSLWTGVSFLPLFFKTLLMFVSIESRHTWAAKTFDISKFWNIVDNDEKIVFLDIKFERLCSLCQRFTSFRKHGIQSWPLIYASQVEQFHFCTLGSTKWK